MAERITGEKFGIYTKQPLDLDWRLAVCTTSISIDRSVSEIEVQDNCSGGAVGREPSVISNSLAFEGNISTDPGLSEVGFVELNEIFNAKVKAEWKIENETSSIIFYAEKAFISSLSAAMPVGDLATYSISLAVDGPLLNAEPS
jgi:hypothetical protein